MKDRAIFETQDGSHSLFSDTFGVSYHSKYGAIQESMHVFIHAGLLHVLEKKSELAILDIGFGTGLNALLTYAETIKRPFQAHYEAIEAYPLSITEAAQLNYPHILGETFRGPFDKLHQLDWGVKHRLSTGFSFQKNKILFQDIEYDQLFDVIYFDAFAPNAQPELWEEDVLERMYNALKPEGVLVTYCAKGAVKRILKKLGFRVEALQGPPGKREMTRAVK
jgi:tRNA U34 5-methylaminomethyl-2-thiouridine-forming methyltransferase MnmC